MRLVTFRRGEGVGIGAVVGDRVVDLRGLDVPEDMLGLIAAGDEAIEKMRSALRDGLPSVPFCDVELLAPIPRPHRNVFCVGKNYREHASEFQNSGFDASASEHVPSDPVFFSKVPGSVSAPGAPICLSVDPTRSVDYEGELAVVIGKGGRGISKAEALGHVFGYTIINDVTARELQKRHRQWLIGKSLDGFCPMGPAIVTADEIPDPAALNLLTMVNGEIRQEAPVSDLIFDVPTLIETLSAESRSNRAILSPPVPQPALASASRRRAISKRATGWRSPSSPSVRWRTLSQADLRGRTT